MVEDWFAMIPVANVNTQFIIFGIYTQLDMALIVVDYIFTGMYSIFQSIGQS